jgi:hypothetical protein
VGRHEAVVEGVNFSFELREPGWFSSEFVGVLLKSRDGISPRPWVGVLSFWSPDGVYVDPCDHTQSRSVGPTAAEMAAAIAALPGLEATEPSDVVVDDIPGKHVVFTVPEDIACPPSSFYLWFDDVEGPRWTSDLPSSWEVWIFDVGASRLFIESELLGGSDIEVQEEMAEIVSSINFD